VFFADSDEDGTEWVFAGLNSYHSLLLVCLYRTTIIQMLESLQTNRGDSTWKSQSPI
jgi:hypothetical protein